MSALRQHDDAGLPEGWRMVRLGDVVEINQLNWDPSDDDPILYLDLTAVLSPGRLAEPRELAASDAPSRARRRVRSGDVLVSTVRPNLRGFARVRTAVENLVASTGFAVLTPSFEAINSFVYHHVMTDQFAANLEAAATGQAYPAVRPEDVGNYRITLPPLPEQHAIADVLDSIDEAIERTEAVIAATKTLRDSLLHELLTRGVPGWHTEWKDVPGIGAIPADWEVVRLGEVIADGPTNGIYKPDSDYGSGWPIIRIDDFISGELLNQGQLRRIRVEPKEARRYAVEAGDILINRVNSLSHIGKTVLVPKIAEDTLFESNMMKLTLCDKVHPKFGEIVLLSEFARRHFVARAKKAVQQASINQPDVAALPFPLPALVEQECIVDSVSSSIELIDDLRIELGWLNLAHNATADALLTGKVRAAN